MLERHANTVIGFPFRENSKDMGKLMLSYKFADSLLCQGMCPAYRSVGLFPSLYLQMLYKPNM